MANSLSAVDYPGGTFFPPPCPEGSRCNSFLSIDSGSQKLRRCFQLCKVPGKTQNASDWTPFGISEGLIGNRVLSGYYASTTQSSKFRASFRDGIPWWDASSPFLQNHSKPKKISQLWRWGGSVSCRSSSQEGKGEGESSSLTTNVSDNGNGEGGQKIVTPESLWMELKPTISYLGEFQLATVYSGLQLAYRAHDGQKRKSGEPYIIHPVEVARLLGELEMDWETITAGLLHDTVEDTTYVTFEEIESMFGPVVRRIVEGETKVSKLGKMQCHSPEMPVRDVKADDLRQMFLAMTEEVRVIIVKLADRLHNMRTLTHMPPHKQKYIAGETLQVFAPLARLLGMYRIKSELEELSFMYAYPDQYSQLKRRIDVLCNEQEEVVLQAKAVLLEAIERDKFLDLTTVDVKVMTLCKEPYSIHKKILESGCGVDEVRDIAQLRIVLKLQEDAKGGDLCSSQQVCYHVLGLIHARWPPVPGSVKDYIATPKPNGYQSLHTTVLPLGFKSLFPLEIQIRTEEMDKLAEWGIAAHHSGREPQIVEDVKEYNIKSLIGGNVFPVANNMALESIAAVLNGAANGVGAVVEAFSGENDGNYNGNNNGGVLKSDSSEKAVTEIIAENDGVGKNRPKPSKGWSNCLNDEDIARRVSWLNSIREWQEEFVGNMTSREFVDTITGDLLGSRVFVFTPKGEVKNLPKGATVVDYAYHIHTDVGNKMVAAKVNGNIVSPMHALANAEVVEILTYDGASTGRSFQMHQQWLNAAKTRSAKHKLIKFLREQSALRSGDSPSITFEDSESEWSTSSDETEGTEVNTEGETTRKEYKNSSREKFPDFSKENLKQSYQSFQLPELQRRQDEIGKKSSMTSSGSFRSDSIGNSNGKLKGSEVSEVSSSSVPVFEEVNNRNPSNFFDKEEEGEEPGKERRRGLMSENSSMSGSLPVTEKKPPLRNGKRVNSGQGLSLEVNWDPGASRDLVKEKERERERGKKEREKERERDRERAIMRDPRVEKVVAGFVRWQIRMVSMWQEEGNGKTVQWLNVNCVDRTGLLAEVSGILTGAGLLICTHAGQTERQMGVGVMLFEVEGYHVEDLALVCEKLTAVEGVLSFALGCTWRPKNS